MSKLLTVLYEVADIRAACQRVHEERFGLSPRRILNLIAGRPAGTATAQCTELRYLARRLEVAQQRLDDLEAEDLEIRRGREIDETLRLYIAALGRSVAGLEQLCRYQRAAAVAPAGDDAAPLKVAYDDALQQQKRLAVRLNALIISL